MKSIAAAIYAEFMKIRRSRILLATLVVFTFIPLMMGLMMFVVRNPDIAGKLGMIGTKAKLFGENDWQGYFALMMQILASVGLIGYGFVTSWVFGREHIDRTMKDLLALPVKRSDIVFAKMLIVFLWCILLALILYVVSIALGLLMNLPGWSILLLRDFTTGYVMAAVLTLLLCSPVSFITGYSRGIIAPLGFVLLTMIMAQFTGLIGLGPYFPWTIPGLFSVSDDAPGMQLHFVSYMILVITFVIGYWATLRWWQHADHH
jgi:ABC-2 type transport system permease protein